MDWKWRRLEKDWRWTDCGLEVDSMDEIGTGGGLHEDPWGSVRYSAVEPFSHSIIRGSVVRGKDLFYTISG